jgi:predicted AlkP superfamily pyrophosphatase or phosphodiesterase
MTLVGIQHVNQISAQLLIESSRAAYKKKGGRTRQTSRRIFALLLWAIAVLGQILPGQALPAQAQSSPQRPKLVVLLVADQFSYNYLPRYLDKFTAGGIKLLIDRGANFTHCQFQNASTQTAVGHSIIASGAYPWATGIVGDEWYDRRKSKPISAVSDESMKTIGGNGAGSSSHYMQGNTIGDQMKLATNGRSKVISISLEDKSSLLLAGRLANGAYWWDTKTGAFVTSSQYGSEIPAWLQAFNDRHYADKYFGQQWQRVLAEDQYTASTRDDYPAEKAITGGGNQFPHIINGGTTGAGEAFFNTFAMTPWSNQMLCDVAKDAIDKESLGSHTDADFLAVSFSAGELLGASFGPYSQEVEDLAIRLDQSLSGLIQHLDQKVGLDNCLIVFTADHGVAPMPEFLKERGMESSRIDVNNFKTSLDAALDGRLGAENWIDSFEPPNLYLNLSAIDRQKYRQPDVEALSAKLARSIAGVGEVYTAAQFFTNQLPSGPLMDAVRKSYYWGRSGELFVMPRPGHIFMSESTGTTTGSPYNYDTQVPLIISGSTVQNGRFAQNSSPADIAPTIANILGIEQPSICEGRVLSEALSTGGARGR